MLNLQWLLQLMQMLGAKLPQAWPHILAIYTHVLAIVTIINGDNVPVAMQRGAAYVGEGKREADKILALAREHGINIEEVKQTVNGLVTVERFLDKKN